MCREAYFEAGLVLEKVDEKDGQPLAVQSSHIGVDVKIVLICTHKFRVPRYTILLVTSHQTFSFYMPHR